MTSMNDLVRANEAIGHHWFDPSSMRHFGTKIESPWPVLIGDECYFFVTSEQDTSYGDNRAWNGRRRFTIRYSRLGVIHTFSEFGEYGTRKAATNALNALVASTVEVDK